MEPNVNQEETDATINSKEAAKKRIIKEASFVRRTANKLLPIQKEAENAHDLNENLKLRNR